MPETRVSSSAIFQTLDRCALTNYTRGEYFRRILWEMVQATLFRIPLPRCYSWRRFLLRCFGAKMGHQCAVHSTTKVRHPWLLELGDWSTIGPGSTVYNLGRIVIGNHTVISQDVYLCGGTHDYTKPDLPLIKATIRIGGGAWIGAGAFVGPGAVVGENSVIGARSVVIGEIPAGVVAAGNPCRVIKPRAMNPA